MKKAVLSLVAVLPIVVIVAFWQDSESDNSDLQEQLSEIYALIPERDAQNKEVSSAPVAWHLDHTLRTINRLSERLATSKPENYKSKFSLARIFVHTTGNIPRGRTQATNSVRPPDKILTDSLYIQLKLAKENLGKISKLDKHCHFEHPIFKTLNRDQTRRFLEVHTKHHLKIIGDILE